jgi:fructose-1,6-bisphosphatase
MKSLINNPTNNKTTFNQYLIKTFPDSVSGASLANLLINIAECTKKIAALTSKGKLERSVENVGATNVQGEIQINLDVLSNELFVSSLKQSGLVSGLVSEELDDTFLIDAVGNCNKFLVVFDPLDGSSNVDVNVSVGSIFSVYKDHLGSLNFLQAGNAQIAAGYALYGPCTMLVITIGSGVQGFTLDTETQEFVLTHSNIRIPETTSDFSINASNERHWEAPVQRYIDSCKAGVTGVRGRDFNMRWVASMVADVHRILMRGGVYLYPYDNKQPTKAGRLRLLYEANPMSFIVEQAGGKSSTGRKKILDIKPDEIHQRVPVIMGSRLEVSLIELYHSEFDSTQQKEKDSIAPKQSEFTKSS